MASIYRYETKGTTSERAGHKWRVVYRNDAGAQRSKWGFKTKKAAEEFIHTLEVSKVRGEYVDPTSSKITVGELAAPWLARKKAQLKPSTFRALESAYRTHVAPVWAEAKIRSIRKTHVEKWLADMLTGDSPSGRPAVGATIVIRSHEILSGVLDDAISERRLISNPARGVTLPRKQKKPHVYLSYEQIAALAAHSGREGLILTLAFTGIRWGEAAGLQVKHVDFERRRLTVERNIVELTAGQYDVTTPKNGKARQVPFPEFLEPYLREAVKDKLPAAPVFTEAGGGHLVRPHSRAGWFAAAVRAAGVEHITPHDLRHSAASFAVSAGANVKVVQRMLGHQSATMTLDTYAELFDGDLDSVADAINVAAVAAFARPS